MSIIGTETIGFVIQSQHIMDRSCVKFTDTPQQLQEPGPNKAAVAQINLQL